MIGIANCRRVRSLETIALVALLGLFWSNSSPSSAKAVEATPIQALSQASAGADMAAVLRDVEALAALSKAHIAEVGLEKAVKDFMSSPWRRDANGLHVWGVTRDGVSWFDAGHPELVGLDVGEMSDMEGRNWSRLAWASGSGEGEEVFLLLFPHPTTTRARKGLHKCYLVGEGDRVLCAGAFEDRDK